ncbi:AI-2 transport protein TqsA [mine drainage metagenome]|uniref:AI-2 transport protein TqsA n=1 Tax=mine drainage metagenome TaxID=410659 RepID=A0A1J5RHC9_9ZZZZ
MQISEANKIRLAWLVLLLGALWLVSLLGPVLMPFLVALTLAYALHPAVERLWRWRIPRPAGATIAIVLLSVALVAIGSLIVSVLSSTLPQLQHQIPLLLSSMNNWLSAQAARLGLQTQFDLTSLKHLLTQSLSGNPQRWAGQLLSSARTGGSTLIVVAGNLVLIPVLTFYFLLDWQSLMQRSFNLVPLNRREALQAFLAECDSILGRYVRGQVSVMLILAAYYAIGLSLAGFQLALPIGVFTGLAVFVPYVGFGLGLILALLAGALQFQSFYALWAVAVVYGIGQVAESMVITPRLLGGQIGLHPLLVIFLLLAFGQLFGFVGVLLALPAGALLLVVIRHALVWYRTSSLFLRG